MHISHKNQKPNIPSSSPTTVTQTHHRRGYDQLIGAVQNAGSRRERASNATRPIFHRRPPIRRLPATTIRAARHQPPATPIMWATHQHNAALLAPASSDPTTPISVRIPLASLISLHLSHPTHLPHRQPPPTVTNPSIQPSPYPRPSTTVDCRPFQDPDDPMAASPRRPDHDRSRRRPNSLPSPISIADTPASVVPSGEELTTHQTLEPVSPASAPPPSAASIDRSPQQQPDPTVPTTSTSHMQATA